MKKMMLLLGLLSIQSFAGEYIVIPHIASDVASFESKIVLENRSSEALQFSLLGFNQDQVADSVPKTLEAGARHAYSVADLFGEQTVTHLFIDAIDGLFAGVEYIPTNNADNRTYVEGIRDFSHRWRVYPSNWETTFDGLVLVAPNCFQIDLSIVHYTASGEYLGNIPLEGGALFGFGKLLFNLGRVFEKVEGSYVEVVSSHAIAAMGLKGTLPNAEGVDFLVGNQAERYPIFEALSEEVKARRAQWGNSELSNAYTMVMQNSCFCTHTRPARLSVVNGNLGSMEYTDDDSEVELSAVKHYKTMDQVFEAIESAILMGADDIQITWDEEGGYPTSVNINWLSCAVDEESNFLITEVRPAQ